MNQDYIVQEFIEPSTRSFQVEGEAMDFKTDFRAYIYDKEVFLLTSRLYQGQTTNFRTAGGGFSPVIMIPQI
ncbi:hypothetical protein [Leptospira sp. GIMC2001]|uniref:hypothetical protein n=1 Tax=Leptospira sp. GIMC2001 TaxID=1513297 RepID=UPI00234B3471|nr:hypothetical protein [Leptospira sp. GIMC2001]WCL48968.1 hypothetical protein O4O04_16975 [Leptospira sp. GIMC2001]